MKASKLAAIDPLAAAAGCDAPVLHRVLKQWVLKGIFQETSPGHFALNDAARGLLDPAQRLFLDLDSIGGRLAYAWGTLPTLVRTGTPGYGDLFGLPFWEDLDANPAVAATFDAFMGLAGHGQPDPEVLIAADWDAARTVVDIGGGTGALLAAILRAHPTLLGTLVDHPRAVAGSEETFQAAGVAERVTTRGQSFFDPLPAGADLYLLKSVVNDWPDREATAILRRCAEAALPAGRVIIVGGITPDDQVGGVTPDMVLLGGKERTLTEFRALADDAGLAIQAVGQQPSGRIVVECRPI